MEHPTQSFIQMMVKHIHGEMAFMGHWVKTNLKTNINPGLLNSLKDLALPRSLRYHVDPIIQPSWILKEDSSLVV